MPSDGLNQDWLSGLAKQAETEQMMAAMGQWATYMRRYYEAMCEQGFTPEQAMTLVIEFQRDTNRGKRGES